MSSEAFEYTDSQTNLDLAPRNENEPSPERFYIPRADIITVSGPHATYKTTAAEIITGNSTDERNYGIQTQLQVEGFQLVTVGQMVRDFTERETGRPFAEDFSVDADTDNLIDTGQEAIMRSVRVPHRIVIEGEDVYTTDLPRVVEGRYSGFIGAKVDAEETGRLYAPRIERVLFYSTDQDEQLRVLANRERPKNPDLTDPELIELGLEREQELNAKAHEQFPYLPKNKGIYDPKLAISVETTNDEGKQIKIKVPVYTITIDTAGKMPHEIAREFHTKLLQRGAIAEIKRSDFSPTLIGMTAYLTLLMLPRCAGLLERNQCNRLGTRTVDVYMGGKLTEQVPACTNDHARKIMRKRISSTNSRLAFSKNGFPLKQVA